MNVDPYILRSYAQGGARGEDKIAAVRGLIREEDPTLLDRALLGRLLDALELDFASLNRGLRRRHAELGTLRKDAKHAAAQVLLRLPHGEASKGAADVLHSFLEKLPTEEEP